MGIKEQLAAMSKRLSSVKYPGLEGAFFRRMNGEERTVYIESCGAAKEAKDYSVPERVIVAYCLCDGEGTRQYSIPDDLKFLDGEVLEGLAKEAAAVNGLGPENPEELEKKVQAATPGATTA